MTSKLDLERTRYFCSSEGRSGRMREAISLSRFACVARRALGLSPLRRNASNHAAAFPRSTGIGAIAFAIDRTPSYRRTYVVYYTVTGVPAPSPSP